MIVGVAQHYDWHEDVLTVRLLDLPADFSLETPSGFVVHYSRHTGQPVGLEVRRYCLRFGAKKQVLRIDSDPPLEVLIEANAGPAKLATHVLDFDRAMGLIEGAQPPPSAL